MLEVIKDKLIHAIYLNFPFCAYPCTYCHYTENLFFGYTEVPNEYFDVLCNQLDETLKCINTSELDCVYFGGGTASLINDSQIDYIKSIFDKYDIKLKEISIELHPRYINFDYENNTWFTRYSIGVQTFDIVRANKYHRLNYSQEDISNIINNIKKISSRKINLDFIFEDTISAIDIEFVNTHSVNSVTFYPNTKGRGENRLKKILGSFKILHESIFNFRSLAKNPFIFLRDDELPTKYTNIEYLDYGNIIGIGHNSYSLIDSFSYLTLYINNNIEYKKRYINLDRRLISFFSSIPFGVNIDFIMKEFPEIIELQILSTVADDNLVGEKHTILKGNELLYLPKTEYIRFYKEFMCTRYPQYNKFFLKSVGYGDGDFNTINNVYNRHTLDNSFRYKKKTPSFRILIEGIDGSGKDTFARMLVEKLKERFYYDIDSRISVLGQPDSRCAYGMKVKRFVEDLDYNTSEHVLQNMLIENRVESEVKINELPGIILLIRGLVTDKATYNYVFGQNQWLGEGEIIKIWDIYIVIDIEPEVANQRIDSRGIERTWRESLTHLTYFREYFKNYYNKIFKDKIIIYNKSLSDLEAKAIELADEIYGRC